MVNLGLSRVDDEVAAKHPGLKAYASCQSRVFMMGVVTFLAGSVTTMFIQNSLKKRLPYAKKWNILLSAVAGTLVSYAVTSRETEKCSRLWIYLETGHDPKVDNRESQQTPGTSQQYSKTRNKYDDEIE